MTEDEVKELLRHLALSYSSFTIVEEKVITWHEELSLYDAKDVWNRLKKLMTYREYSLSAPTLETLIAGLTKKSLKVDFNRITYFCKRCRRAFNDRNKLLEHEERCNSINYIERQYKRFNLGTIDKKELYNLPFDEFNFKYEKLLKKVQEISDREDEKRLIDYIFSPPSEKEAKDFLGV